MATQASKTLERLGSGKRTALPALSKRSPLFYEEMTLRTSNGSLSATAAAYGIPGLVRGAHPAVSANDRGSELEDDRIDVVLIAWV